MVPLVLAIPVLSAAAGSVITYCFTQGEYPQELLDKIGGKAMLDQYVALRQDPLTKDNDIYLDEANKCLIDNTAHKTYMAVKTAKNERSAGEVVGDANGMPLYKTPTSGWDWFAAKTTNWIPLYGDDDGAPVYGSNPVYAKYKVPGSAEEKTIKTGTSCTDFLKMREQSTSRYYAVVWKERAETTKNYIKLAKEFDDLPAAEKQKYETRVKPEFKGAMNNYLHLHCHTNRDGNKLNASCDNDPAVKACLAPELDNISDGKKLYIMEQGFKRGAVGLNELHKHLRDTTMQHFLIDTKTEVDMTGIFKDIQDKKDKSAGLKETIAKESAEEDKKNSISGKIKGFFEGLMPDFLKDGWGKWLLGGLGVVGGIMLVNSTIGNIPLIGGILSTIIDIAIVAFAASAVLPGLFSGAGNMISGLFGKSEQAPAIAQAKEKGMAPQLQQQQEPVKLTQATVPDFNIPEGMVLKTASTSKSGASTSEASLQGVSLVSNTSSKATKPSAIVPVMGDPTLSHA